MNATACCKLVSSFQNRYLNRKRLGFSILFQNTRSVRNAHFIFAYNAKSSVYRYFDGRSRGFRVRVSGGIDFWSMKEADFRNCVGEGNAKYRTNPSFESSLARIWRLGLSGNFETRNFHTEQPLTLVTIETSRVQTYNRDIACPNLNRIADFPYLVAIETSHVLFSLIWI